MQVASNIRISQHAEKRAQQRAIPEVARWLLLEFANPRADTYGCEVYEFDKRSWREVERFFGPWALTKMGQLRKVYLVLNAQGDIVTLAYRN